MVPSRAMQVPFADTLSSKFVMLMALPRTDPGGRQAAKVLHLDESARDHVILSARADAHCGNPAVCEEFSD
jgi:hypothetical protein